MISIKKHGIREDHIVYVGRTRPVGRGYRHTFHELGNPFIVGRDGNRTEVVEKYREWLAFNAVVPGKVQDALLALAAIHKRYGKLVLVCHCITTSDLGGNVCHAQVIGQFVREMI